MKHRYITKKIRKTMKRSLRVRGGVNKTPKSFFRRAVSGLLTRKNHSKIVPYHHTSTSVISPYDPNDPPVYPSPRPSLETPESQSKSQSKKSKKTYHVMSIDDAIKIVESASQNKKIPLSTNKHHGRIGNYVPQMVNGNYVN
uniref:Uncharacterized protein n=1 Tax=viral metagenome TaxID=1070528 RepID=A0A6C0HTP6_9ZZZZ